MIKIKAFGCIVLVIALVMVFSLVSVPEIASAYIPTEEDKEFIDFVERHINSSVNGFNDILDYDSTYRIFSLEEKIDNERTWAEARVVLAIAMYLNTSKELEPLKQEFVKENEEFIVGYGELMKAVKSEKHGNMEESERYTDKAKDHFKKALQHNEQVKVYLEMISQGKAPTTNGFGTIFAIGSLLAVAYLVLRRKNE